MIGIYTVLRHNVMKLPDGQIFWSNTTEVFDKIFLPLAMATASICSLLSRKSNLWFAIATIAMTIDFILRVKDTVNLAYVNAVHLTGEGHGLIFPVHPDMQTHWPSFVMCLMELILLIFIVRYLAKNYKLISKS